ncbi:hypothetical protein WN51_10003 [Melipona quadrifasciata]|uniref:Uncharacterized protein n=2 Tax=Meliponini TaxID=83319 RepID=A0A0N0U7M2_9HYME|nr:hypothetical protein WN51_10003 [Melipona quadrifasciata]
MGRQVSGACMDYGAGSLRVYWSNWRAEKKQNGNAGDTTSKSKNNKIERENIAEASVDRHAIFADP